jgi:hypothetical protein
MFKNIKNGLDQDDLGAVGTVPETKLSKQFFERTPTTLFKNCKKKIAKTTFESCKNDVLKLALFGADVSLKIHRVMKKCLWIMYLC